MQSVLKQQPKLRLSLIAVACQLACLGIAHAQTEPVKLDADGGQTRSVVITGKKVGMGLMVTEDAPRTRSTVTAEELEKQRPTGNAYQALEMMPSVNSYNYDATGLFGGGMTMRGFNSDQLGATINGAPVNDSGNFAVYPQEYVDQENTCSEYVTQGSADVDAPQVGASGGNFGIRTCNPEDAQRVRLMETVGQLNMHKHYVRYDTGLFLDGKTKAFISYSDASTKKWKGPGEGQRNHVDVGINHDWDRFNYIHATVLYNQSMNNNIGNLSLAQLNQFGYNYDYNPVFTGKILNPVTGKADVEKISAPQYYKLANNPFKNTVATMEGKFRLTDNLDVKVLPYFWYGYGTGGVQEQTVTENKLYNSSTGKLNAATDINGDHDTLDTIIVANGSVTRTSRPGVTSELIYTYGDHQILGGVWVERARHEQTGPAVGVTAQGYPYGMNYYQEEGRILRPDGHPYEFRDGLTKSNVEQYFIQDTVTMLGDKAQLNVGVRAPHITRNFTNYANEGTGVASPYNYNLERSWSDVLPNVGLRYRVTNDDQLYTSITKNMKAPPNYALFPSNANVQVNAQGQVYVAVPVRKEVSYDTEIGYRHQSKAFIASVSLFNINFRDRQASSVDPITGLTNSLVNVGKVHMRGAEFEIGNTPINGWSFYGSLGYLQAEIGSDLLVDYAKNISLPINGKQYPMSPRLKGNLSAEYQQGDAWGRLKVRATSKQQADLLNTETVPGYTVLDFDAGYKFPNYGALKNPKLTFNVSNILSREYRNPSSNGTTNASAYTNAAGATYAGKTVFYYLAQPRFASLTLSVEF
jgi:iron complex outermembrane receptor protein